LSVLTFGAGALGVVGITIAGVMYMTARDNTEQTAKAKKRLLEVAVALIFLAGAGAVTNWLVPGGILINASGSSGSSGSGPSTNQPSGGGGSGGSGNPATPADPSGSTGSENLGNREAGSESMEGATGGVGNGSEGWVEQGAN